MSVPKYKRKESNVEYIDTARELALHTLRYTNKKFAKKDMDLVRTIRNLSFSILNDVSIANSIYVVTMADKELRRGHLIKAKGDLYALNTLLSVIKDPKLMQNTVTPYGWRHWGEIISKEINLISKVMKSDLKKEI